MDKAVDLFFRVLELLMVVAMGAMVVMVFGNVVLRYGFNSGIDVSDEMSRYAFIWLTFIGAMVAMREGGHLGVDSLLRQLPRAGRKACLALSEGLMLMINALFFLGTWKMHALQVSNISPVVGISMIWVYGVGYVVAVVMALFNLRALWRLATGRISDAELARAQDAQEAPETSAPPPAAPLAGTANPLEAPSASRP